MRASPHAQVPQDRIVAFCCAKWFDDSFQKEGFITANMVMTTLAIDAKWANRHSWLYATIHGTMNS